MTHHALENFTYEGDPRTGFVYIRESITGRRIATVLGRNPEKIINARRFAAVPAMARALHALLAADVDGNRERLYLGKIMDAMDDAAAALHLAEHGVLLPSPLTPSPRIDVKFMHGHGGAQ